MILGTAEGKSVPDELAGKAARVLSSGKYQLSVNHPFKGGFITRHFGKPEIRQYALQLEMSKDLYMDDEEKSYDAVRANHVQSLLKRTLSGLIETLQY